MCLLFVDNISAILIFYWQIYPEQLCDFSPAQRAAGAPGGAPVAADHVSAGQEERVQGLVHAHAARQRLAHTARPRTRLLIVCAVRGAGPPPRPGLVVGQVPLPARAVVHLATRALNIKHVAATQRRRVIEY